MEYLILPRSFLIKTVVRYGTDCYRRTKKSLWSQHCRNYEMFSPFNLELPFFFNNFGASW